MTPGHTSSYLPDSTALPPYTTLYWIVMEGMCESDLTRARSTRRCSRWESNGRPACLNHTFGIQLHAVLYWYVLSFRGRCVSTSDSNTRANSTRARRESGNAFLETKNDAARLDNDV